MVRLYFLVRPANEESEGYNVRFFGFFKKYWFYMKGVSKRDEPKETFAEHPCTASQKYGRMRDRNDADTG